MIDGIYIIAEGGVNHNGRLDLALELVDKAKEAGADAIKFQTFITEKIMTRSVSLADYQSRNVPGTQSQYDMVKGLEMSWGDFRIINAHCEANGIQFLSTPDEEWSLDFLVDELRLPTLKVGSGEIDNYPYLRRVAAKKLPVILSTGMCVLGEVEAAVRILTEGGCPHLSLLHCTTNYPCPADEVNLLSMNTLRDAFKLEVGYSDHTLGIEIPIAAAALGARIIEKHFTLDCSMEGPDHQASLNPVQFHAMVRGIRKIEQALGTGRKAPNPSEEMVKPLIRKRLVATRPIHPEAKLEAADIILKRASCGIEAGYFDLLLGRRLRKPIGLDDPFTWEHFFLE